MPRLTVHLSDWDFLSPGVGAGQVFVEALGFGLGFGTDATGTLWPAFIEVFGGVVDHFVEAVALALVLVGVWVVVVLGGGWVRVGVF
jgi:hypothetical protein